MPWPAVSHCTSPAAEARGRAERVGVIDEALSNDRDRLEAAVRMMRETRHDVAVIHPPAVLALEVLADVAAGERRVRAHPLVAAGVSVVVMDAEQERIGRFPGKAQRHDREDRRRARAARRIGCHQEKAYPAVASLHSGVARSIRMSPQFLRGDRDQRMAG